MSAAFDLLGAQPAMTKIARPLGPDLHPGVGAAAAVGAVGALAHHALEAEAAHVLEHPRAGPLDVFGVADGTAGRQHRLQQLLAGEQRELAEVVAEGLRQVERVVGDGQRVQGAGDLHGAPEPRPLLQQREARNAARVVDHGLAVDDELGEG